MLSKNKVNNIIRTLILSDFFLFFAVGLLTPIFAIFIIENITDKIEVIGYAVACYWITRVIMVVPLSRLMDKLKGENDEYYFMIGGTFLISIIPLFYIISSEPWHIYLLQILNGIAYTMAAPAWRIIFTNHIDRHIVGFEWSLEDVGIGIATALSAAIGAQIADKFGFNILFGMIFFFGIIGTLVLLALNRHKKSILQELVQTRAKIAPIKIDTFK
jgi:MFS family permease